MRTHIQGDKVYMVVKAYSVCGGCAFYHSKDVCSGRGFTCTGVIAIDPKQHNEYIAARVVHRMEQGNG
jgi:hypothetical protein